MGARKAAKDKKSDKFFKNPWNILFLALITIMVVYAFSDKDERGKTTVDRIVERFQKGEAGETLVQNIGRSIEKVTEGCEKPKDEEVEAHFKDNAGSLSVAEDFDADPDEICGNGKTFYCTSKPPKKPIPTSWSPPPLPGSDPNYLGPKPGEPFKESPYAMPSPKIVLVRKPIEDKGDRTLVKEVLYAAERAPGKIGFVGDKSRASKFSHLDQRLTHLDQKLFEGDDDAPIAKKLLKMGVDFVLVDRLKPAIKPWIEEKMSTLRLRLRDAVSLAWFHPVVVGSGYAMYRIAPGVEIPKHSKRRITARVREILSGQEPSPVEVSEIKLNENVVGDSMYRAIVSLRWRSEKGMKGRKVTKKIADGATLVEALDAAANRIKSDWPRIANAVEKDKNLFVSKVSSDLAKAIENMEIEIDVLYDMCALTDRTIKNLLWYLELGLEGVSLRGKVNFHYLEPSYAVHMEVTSPVIFVEKMLMKQRLKQFLRDPKKKKNKKRGKVLNESTWYKDSSYRLGRFRTVNWIERSPGGDIVELYRGTPLKTIWDVTRSALVRSLELGAQWLMTNQSDDGQYAYKYTPTNKPGKRWTPGGNIVRHALNPYTLLMVNKISPKPEYVTSAKKGIEFTLNFLRRKGNRCVICHRDPPARYYNAKIGTVAVTILSILKLGDVADISEYDDVLRCLAEELLFVQDKNGHFWQYDVPKDHPYYGAESTIAPGEFIFALSRLYTHYKDEKYKESVDRALPWYMTAWRKLLSERTKEGVFDEEHRVNLIGIVPWLVTAMNDLHKTTGEQKYADIAFEQQDWIDDEYYWYLNRAQYPDYAGASYKVHRELPAINSCQYTEGASAAYDLAKRVNKNVETRRQVVVHGMRFCLQTQYDSYDSTFFLPIPKEAMGGYRYTIGHLRLRNDYNYHAMAAIAQAVEYLEPDDYPSERPLRIPPVLKELLGGLENPKKDVPRTRPISQKAKEIKTEKDNTRAKADSTASEPAAKPAQPKGNV